jgi:hypothetical protein
VVDFTKREDSSILSRCQEVLERQVYLSRLGEYLCADRMRVEAVGCEALVDLVCGRLIDAPAQGV